VVELTFATKSLFFIMLGYWTDVHHMVDWRAWVIAAIMFAVIYASRTGILRMLRIEDERQLVWIAPRGLITVLLFLSAAETGAIDEFPFGAVTLLVLATSTATALAHRIPAAASPASGPTEAAATATAPRLPPDQNL